MRNKKPLHKQPFSNKQIWLAGKYKPGDFAIVIKLPFYQDENTPIRGEFCEVLKREIGRKRPLFLESLERLGVSGWFSADQLPKR